MPQTNLLLINSAPLKKLNHLKSNSPKNANPTFLLHKGSVALSEDHKYWGSIVEPQLLGEAHRRNNMGPGQVMDRADWLAQKKIWRGHGLLYKHCCNC